MTDDAIIIGAGHNGLVTACCLARPPQGLICSNDGAATLP